MIPITLILDVLSYHGFISIFPNQACKKPSVRDSLSHNCFLTCEQRLTISPAVMLFNILTISVTLYIGTD